MRGASARSSARAENGGRTTAPHPCRLGAAAEHKKLPSGDGAVPRRGTLAEHCRAQSTDLWRARARRRPPLNARLRRVRLQLIGRRRAARAHAVPAPGAKSRRVRNGSSSKAACTSSARTVSSSAAAGGTSRRPPKKAKPKTSARRIPASSSPPSGAAESGADDVHALLSAAARDHKKRSSGGC